MDYESKIMDEILSEISTEDAKRIERNMVLATQIADEMELKGYSNEDLAEILKKDVSEIEKWLSGTYTFTPKEIQKIKWAIYKCKSHKKTKGYMQWYEWAKKKIKRGAKQKQCPKCKCWFFKENFGKGWYKKANENDVDGVKNKLWK